jgi:hypothetical protein
MGVSISDERLVAVDNKENKATTEINKTYNDMIEQSDSFYKAQMDASKNWADKQQALQQEKTDFAIEQINQQKDQAEKDYIKEQSGAYVDWQKQSNQYGVNAEAMAQNGMMNGGYAESSQVAMYTAYQNRVATARDSYNRAVLNYDNAIKDAQLQNNSAMAEIAYNSLQQQLELALQGFQYKNTLVTEKIDKKMQTHQMYRQEYQNVLNQINTEKALAEEIRQYNEKMAEEKRQYNESLALQKAQFEEQKRQYNETMAFNKAKASNSSSSSGGSGGSSGSSGIKKTASNNTSTTKTISTKTSGKSQLEKDAEKYGTFSNGYQPKGVGNHGAVSKTGKTVEVNGKTQNVWKTGDGAWWVWNGTAKEYKQVKNPLSTKGGGAGLGVASMLYK